MDLVDLRKRAIEVNRYGGGSGYWAGKVLALIDLINAERIKVREQRANPVAGGIDPAFGEQLQLQQQERASL